MAIRNILLRIASLAISILLVLYVKYVYADPDAASVNIMLATLLFSIFRSGFSFDRLSKVRSGMKTVACFTIDKLVLLILVFVYSQYVGIQINNFVFALFSASIITLIYLQQYTRYTDGRLMASMLVSLVFPVQVVTNLALGYFQPGPVFTVVAAMLVLYVSFERYQYTSAKMGRMEVYYSMLLPAAGFTAVSIDGIDKPAYILVAKIIDSIGSVAGFVVQGNLSGAREFVEKNIMMPWFALVSAVLFIAGVLAYLLAPMGGYQVISATVLVNVCWLVYSQFTLVSLIRYGEAALKNIGNQFKCLGAVLLGLYLVGMFEPIYIVIAISASFVCSMLISRSVWRGLRVR